MIIRLIKVGLCVGWAFAVPNAASAAAVTGTFSKAAVAESTVSLSAVSVKSTSVTSVSTATTSVSTISPKLATTTIDLKAYIASKYKLLFGSGGTTTTGGTAAPAADTSGGSVPTFMLPTDTPPEE